MARTCAGRPVRAWRAWVPGFSWSPEAYLRAALAGRQRRPGTAGVDVVLDEEPPGPIAGERERARARPGYAVRTRCGRPARCRLLVIDPDIRSRVVDDRLRVETGRLAEAYPGRVVGRHGEVILCSGRVRSGEGADRRSRARQHGSTGGPGGG